jgi:excisionase family DNA binding protein
MMCPERRAQARVRVASQLNMPVIRRTLQSVAPSESNQDCYKRGFTVSDAAKYVGVSVWQIRQFVQSGELKPATIGNKFIFDRAALDRLLDERFAKVA